MAELFGWNHGALSCGPDAGETPALPGEGLPKRLLPSPPPLGAWKRQDHDFRLHVVVPLWEANFSNPEPVLNQYV